VDVLAVIHGDEARSGTFARAAEARGHAIEEWSIASGSPPPRPLDHYGAVIVFGGAMHADQDHAHPWLRDESLLLEELLDRHVPLLGVCLGAQLIARAAGGRVSRTPEPEVGWHPVELTPQASFDPVFASMPSRFEAFQWHFYTYELPPGAVELARSRVCTQAFRLGDAAWSVQFHPEVTLEQIEGWCREDPEEGEEVPGGAAALLEATRPRIERWNELGQGLCAGFLAAAEGLRAAA
jgi:GMP synthase (glutamine-hydrolysing)